MLYKYFRFNKNSLDALSKRKLWASTPDKFNDPHEFNVRSTFLDDDRYEQRLLFLDQIKNFGIISFSELNNNSTMWGHYSDDHRGFCLGFEFEPKPEAFSVYKVNYNDELPNFDLNNLWTIKGTASALYTKGVEWAHEKEWRNIITDIEGEDLIKNRGGLSGYGVKLREVIFGARTTPENIKSIKQILEKDKVLYFTAVLENDNRKIAIQPLLDN